MSEAKLIAGRYEQLELIGAGGMGSVYRGRDNLTGEFVAIKELKTEVLKQDPEIVQRFEREGEALRKLNHPSIVKVLASVQDGAEHYIVLEYVKGGSLRDKLDATPQLPIREILELALDLTDALARAHRLNIIHRDIKPANVLIADDGSPRLTDFGVARIGDSSQMTKTGVVMGTLSYLPPEALAGDRIDHRADIWAFGVMLYEMVAGQRPFDGDNSGAVVAAILQKEPPDLLTFRPITEMENLGFFAGLIYWMLDKDREKRPDSFRLIGALIENLLAGKGIELNWQVAKVDKEDTISPQEAAAIMREYGTDAFKLSTSDYPPTTPAGIAVPTKTLPNTAKLKRQIKHSPRIFLSYRRDDSIAITGRFYDRLSAAFGADFVFKDMEDIPLGSDFKQVLEREVRNSEVVLAIIGRKWLNAANETGRRLEDPHDFVRIEVESALANPECLVIPVLVDSATMPEERLLPPKMKSLIYRNAALVRNDPDFNRDVEALINQIKNSFELEKPKTSRMPLLFGAVLILLLALFLGFGGMFLNSSNSTNSISIEPIPAGEYLVLVALPQFIEGTERDVQSRIVQDLEENLSSVSYSRIYIRAYPAVIRSSAEAQTIAEAYDAHIILWGNYDSVRVEMNVQVGDLSLFPNLQFSPEELRRFANASYQMPTEREATLAFGVMAVFNAIHTMSNDSIEVGRNVMIFQLITKPSAIVQGNAVNAYYHRYIALYIPDTEAALAELTTAIERVEPHAFLHIARSLAYQRLNRIVDAQREIRIARQLVANPNWIMPEISLVNAAVYFEMDYSQGLAIFPNNFEEAAAGNWFFPTYRGSLRYLTGDYAGAQSDTDLALTLNPSMNIPYAIAASLAFRRGDVINAIAIFEEVRQRFPDARQTSRLVLATLNEDAATSPLARYIMAFGGLISGEWEDIISNTQAIIDSGFSNADVYLLQGFAYCNLGQYAEAEAAYTAGIELDSDFVMLYALRGEVRYRQGLLQLLPAQQDIDFVLNSGQNQLIALAPAVLTGEYSCKNFFTFDFSSLLESTEEANE